MAVEAEAEVVVEEGEAEALQQEGQRQEEEVMQNSTERNHLLSAGIVKMSTGSSQTFRGICL